MAETLVDKYLKVLRFSPHVIVTRHAVERLIERKIDERTFVRHVGKYLKNRLCQLVFDHIVNGPQRIKFNDQRCRFTVCFKFDDVRKKLVITTVY